MKIYRYLMLCLVVMVLPGLFTNCRQNRTIPAADLVLKNGFIYTVDSRQTKAEALAVKNGKIVYVGTNKGVEDYIGKDVKIVDLGGRLVLPGFIDSHCHAISAFKQLYDVDLNGLDSVEAYKKAISDFARKHPDAKYIKGRGWSNTVFGKTGPDKKIIDEIIKDIPVALASEDGHSKWVNSKTLELAGITPKTKDPQGGVIERYPGTKEPSGALRENAADLIARLFPGPTLEQMMNGLKTYQQMALSFGITTVHDASLDAGSDDITTYKNLEKQNQLLMRFRASLYVDPAKGIEQVKSLIDERARHKGPLFQTNAAKIFIDGVVEGSTAYLKEPYQHLPGSRGEGLWEKEALNRMCAELDKNGFQIHVHSIGDAGTAVTLDGFAYALDRNGKRDSRNLITHLQLVDPGDIQRFYRLGVIAVTQPYWFMKDDYYYNLQVPYLGQKRADEEYPMESFFQAGVIVASSSDYPVTIPCNPLRAIRIGITRSRTDTTDPGEVLWPQERVTLEQMIAGFTINGAYANFLEKETGSLETGKMADLMVLDKNLFEIPATEIDKAKVLLTLFEGKEAFCDQSFREVLH